MSTVTKTHANLIQLSELLGQACSERGSFVGADVGLANASTKAALHKWRNGVDVRTADWKSRLNKLRAEQGLKPISAMSEAQPRNFCATNQSPILKGIASLGADRNFVRTAIVATGKTDLVVIDIDVRADKNGNQSLFELEQELRVSLPPTLAATTPSQGRHLYFRYPGLPSKIGLKPGLDIKAKAGYVLAPLDGGDSRRWIDTAYPVAKLPKAFAKFIQKSTSTKAKSFNGGKRRASPLIPEREFGQVLGQYDPRDYRDHDKWFHFMCAFHRTTGGHGLQAFSNWCLSDPDYNSVENKRSIKARWNSLRVGGDHDFAN